MGHFTATMASKKKTSEHRRLQNRRCARESRSRKKVWLSLLEAFLGWCEEILDLSNMTSDQKVAAFRSYSGFLVWGKAILDNPSLSFDDKKEALQSYSASTPKQLDDGIDLYCYENLDTDMMFV